LVAFISSLSEGIFRDLQDFRRSSITSLLATLGLIFGLTVNIVNIWIIIITIFKVIRLV